MFLKTSDAYSLNKQKLTTYSGWSVRVEFWAQPVKFSTFLLVPGSVI